MKLSKNNNRWNVLGRLFLLMSLLLVVVRSEEGECIAPDQLKVCLESVEQTQRESKSKLESQEMALIAEWRDKLNKATETAVQTSRVEWQTECERSKQETLSVVEQKWSNQVSLLEQELQQQKALHEVSLQEKEQGMGRAVETAVALALEQAHRDHATALERLEQAKSLALEQAQRGHATALERLEQAKSLVETEAKLLRDKVTEYQHSYQRTTNELLEARQELLSVHPIVRLYQARFYNRWFVWPAQTTWSRLQENVLTPVGHDVYVLGKPVWDALHKQLVVPIVIPATEFVVSFWWPVVTDCWDCMEYVWLQMVVPCFDHVCHETPVMLQAAATWAYPHVVQMTRTTWETSLHLYQQGSLSYIRHVQPKLMPVKELAVDFYRERLVPLYSDRVRPVWKGIVKGWRLHVVPAWNKAYPVMVANLKTLHVVVTKQYQTRIHPVFVKLQTVAVEQWAGAGRILAVLAQKKQWPTVIHDAGQYMANFPQRSLKQVCTVSFVLTVLLILGSLLGGRVKKSGGKKVKKAAAAKPLLANKKNGVHFYNSPNNNNKNKTTATPPPATPPPHHNNKKKHQQKKPATPYPKGG